jgi:hypothetical protein
MSTQRLHILLTNATRRPYCKVPELPEGSVYDDVSGLWRLGGGKILVRDAAFRSQKTKKCDQETGEDQKGE